MPEFVQEHREEEQAVGAPQVLGLHRDAKVCEHPAIVIIVSSTAATTGWKARDDNVH